MTRTVLSTSSRLTHNFTILCGTWTLLNARKPGPHLIEEIVETCRTQKELESTDHRTSARYVLRDLKKDTKANSIHGLTTVASAGFLNNSSRGQRTLCGEKMLMTKSSTSGTAWTPSTKKTPSKTSEQLGRGSSGRREMTNGSQSFSKQTSPESP